MTIEAHSLEQGGTGVPAQGALLPLVVPSGISAAAHALLDPPSVSFFIVAGQQLSSQLLEILGSMHGASLRGHAASLDEAGRLLGDDPPEVLFLEAALAVAAGEDLPRYLGVWKGAEVVLIVDSPSHALLAYQIRAVDCLMMPIERRAVVGSLGRVLEHIRLRRAGLLGEKLVELFHAVPGTPHSSRIPIRSGGRISFLRMDDIDWLEAQGDYVCLHAGAKKHLVRNKISTLAQQLGSAAFVRIHRSIIVNIDRIRELHPLMHGEYAVVLTDSTRLTLSRSYRQSVLDLLTHARTA